MGVQHGAGVAPDSGAPQTGREGVGEFELIRRYCQQLGATRADVILGVGDDAALLRPRPDMELLLCVDTLVEGVHFFADVAPSDLGHKALAVNLSDIAAMGGEPAWATLALTLPAADTHWLAGFAAGFSTLASAAGVALVGGDTCRGPRAVSVQLAGHVPVGQALRRSTARPGDVVCVSGSLGDAAVALASCLNADGSRRAVADEQAEAAQWLLGRLLRPAPRLALGQALRGIASACIDLSDGLLGDLEHVLTASAVGAVIDVSRLPLSAQAVAVAGADAARHAACRGGDDYELCFTVPEGRMTMIDSLATRCGIALTPIGTIESRKGLRLVDGQGAPVVIAATGYRHFSG